MQTNQSAARPVAPATEGRLFARTRAALANTARSLQTRQQIIRELNLLGDRALADLGLYRSDIRSFARDASRIAGAEGLISAVLGDLKALLGAHGATSAAGRPI